MSSTGPALALLVACVLSLSPFGIRAARADYPDHPVHLIAPFPPAGGIDAAARVMADALSKMLGQAFVVENHPGATGRIGTQLVAKAQPDGYTLLLGSVATNAIVPAAFRNLPYDAIQSFAPVSMIGTSQYALVVPASLPVKSVPDLIALAKAQPHKLNFASTGNLGGPHVAGELFRLLAGIDVVHVPYKGGGPMMSALLGGEVAFAFASLPTIIAHVKSGSLRVLAVTSEHRAPALPDTPTMAEFLEGYRVLLWYGLLAPAGTPAPVVARLNRAMVKALSDPGVKESLAHLDIEANPTTPQGFASQIATDLARYRNLIAKAGIHVE